jgi:hypothetical protein
MAPLFHSVSQLYYTPLLVGLGSIGNILSVFVFFGTKLRKLSSSYYLSALASSDTGFLVTLFGVWLNLIDVPWFNKDGFCQISIYLTMVSSKFFLAGFPLNSKLFWLFSSFLAGFPLNSKLFFSF